LVLYTFLAKVQLVEPSTFLKMQPRVGYECRSRSLGGLPTQTLVPEPWDHGALAACPSSMMLKHSAFKKSCL
jgi:hypothetical protein